MLHSYILGDGELTQIIHCFMLKVVTSTAYKCQINFTYNKIRYCFYFVFINKIVASTREALVCDKLSRRRLGGASNLFSHSRERRNKQSKQIPKDPNLVINFTWTFKVYILPPLNAQMVWIYSFSSTTNYIELNQDLCPTFFCERQMKNHMNRNQGRNYDFFHLMLPQYSYDLDYGEFSIYPMIFITSQIKESIVLNVCSIHHLFSLHN
jgi:hypothetical protein